MRSDLHYSSESDTWETPPALFHACRRRWGPFDIDRAAQRSTAKVATYYGPDHPDPAMRDALAVPWSGSGWINPPYGPNVTGRWVQYAWDEARAGRATSTMLIPARTGAEWFQDFALRADELCLLRGRIFFLENGRETWGSPFDCAILRFDRREGDRVGTWDAWGMPRVTTMPVPRYMDWRDMLPATG